MAKPDTRSAVVSPEWARNHLQDPAVRFVEVDSDPMDYDEGHLPGALFWSWGGQLCDVVRRDLVGHEAMTSLLQRSGIGPGTHVVLYGDRQLVCRLGVLAAVDAPASSG